jgi:thioredoxin-like negative regulator of GroEL
LTLAWAWREIDQPDRARELFDRAIALRPADGQLRVRASSLLAALGQFDEAGELLATAKGKLRDADWLRSRLELAEVRLAFDDVLRIAAELLAAEPLALDAHSAVARAMARRHGLSAVLA